MKTKNVNDTTNQFVVKSTNEIVTKLVNDISSSVEVKNSAMNILKAKNLIANGPGSTVTIEQQAIIEAKNLALIKVLTDSNIQNKLAQDLANEVMAKIDNDTKAMQDLAAISSLKKESEKASGLIDIVNKVADIVGNIISGITNIGKDSKEVTETDIETYVTNSIEMQNENYNSIRNLVDKSYRNAITTEITNISKDKCNFETSATNAIDIENILALNGGNIAVKQIASIDALNQCIIEKNMAAKAVQDIAGSDLMKFAIDYSNKTSQEGKMKTESGISESKKETDAVMDTLKSAVSDIVKLPGNIIGGLVTGLMTPILIIVALVITVIVAFKLVGAIGGSSPSGNSGSSDDYEQEGGAIISGRVMEGLKVPMIVLIIMLAISSAQNKQVKTEQTVVEKQIEKALS
jgi:hypothetical protein